MTPRRIPRSAEAWLVPRLLGPGTVVAVAVAVAIAVWGGRFLIAAREAVVAAEAALARGDRAEATRSYLDALRCYVPGSPSEGRALGGLEALARAAAAAGDSDGERRALEAIRAGLLGTRSILVPFGAHLAKADRRLAELDAAAAFPPAVRPATIVPPRLHGWGAPATHRNLAVGSTLVALLGFAAWVGAVVLFIHRSIRSRPDRPLRRTPLVVVLAWVLPPVLFVIGFAMFLAGLRLA